AGILDLLSHLLNRLRNHALLHGVLHLVVTNTVPPTGEDLHGAAPHPRPCPPGDDTTLERPPPPGDGDNSPVSTPHAERPRTWRSGVVQRSARLLAAVLSRSGAGVSRVRVSRRPG